MRRPLTICALSLIVAVVLALSALPAMAEDNLVSANLGLFSPGADYDNSYDSFGPMMGISLIRVNEYAGLEFGLSSYDIGSGGSGASALGLEILVHFQGRDYDFQPFMALGMGVYETSFSDPYGELNDTGTGFVLKGGARYYFTIDREYITEEDKYFVGAYLKFFSNNISFPLEDNLPDVNAGGMALCFEAGIWTD